MSEVRIEMIKPEYAKALEKLQRDCFPLLAEHELMNEEHFLRHCKLFPEGNFVALVDDNVVGLGSGFFCDFDFDHVDHSFSDFISNGWFDNHDPEGDWYYGADISVHPDYRRRGIGKMLYDARKSCVKKFNRKGIVACGRIPEFMNHKAELPVADYVEKVLAGELYDRIFSFQLKQGFQYRGLVENYIEDKGSDNWATLIVWENPDYSSES